MSGFKEIIKKICDELGIKLTLLSDDWLMVLEKDDKIRYINGFKFSVNKQSISNIMDDKGLFYDLMVYKDFPIIKHKVIFKEIKKEEIIDYFYENNQKIIVKGNIGTCGDSVFLIEDEDDLLNKVNELFNSQFSISLCPYYDILHEYRVIVLDGNCELAYGKNRPVVIGDGKSTLLELAKKFNERYYSKEKHQNFDINYVPKLNEEVSLGFKFNLSKGSTAFLEIDEDLKQKVIDLAEKVSKSLDISFASIDIIETQEHGLLVMEANSGVMMSNIIKQLEDGPKKAYDIYKKAIIKMFEE